MSGTPACIGPWTASVEARPAPASGHWYVVMDADENGIGEFYGFDHDTNAANLRVAAAAPDLLEALEEAQLIVANMPNEDMFLAKINAAIAKARGQ